MKLFITFFLILAFINSSKAADQDSDISAKKVILKYTGTQVIPSKLELQKLDSSVFFLNQSESKSVHLTVDFKDKKLHCHSPNLKLEDDKIKTINPIKPRDFEIMCFPTAGVYSYYIEETPAGKKIKGEIYVSE